MWYGLVNPVNGELKSVGTESMFPDRNINAFVGVYDVVTFGSTAPDFATKIWNPNTKALVSRPAPVLISRLDDIEAWLLADSDWVAVWNSLSAARKTQIRTGLRRILVKLLGPQQFRGESEAVEI